MCNLSGLCNLHFSLGTSTSYLPLNIQDRNKGTLPRGKHRKKKTKKYQKKNQ